MQRQVHSWPSHADKNRRKRACLLKIYAIVQLFAPGHFFPGAHCFTWEQFFFSGANFFLRRKFSPEVYTLLQFCPGCSSGWYTKADSIKSLFLFLLFLKLRDQDSMHRSPIPAAQSYFQNILVMFECTLRVSTRSCPSALCRWQGAAVWTWS